jgi:OmpA-OmpF porin, OOP family
MKRKFLSLLIITCLLAGFASAQDYASPVKGSLVGFSANTTDFSQLIAIKNSFKNPNVNPGFSVMYWKGIVDRLDFSIRYNGIFTEYSKNPNASSSSDYANELEGSFHVRALTDNHFFNPFLTAGIGIGNYGGKWAPYAPLGGGLQFNLGSVTYIFMQLNYRASLSKTNLDNNLFYSLGVTENISGPKAPPPPKVVPIPVVVPPKDRDGDGVVDSLDACPDVAGLAKFNGCPDTDGDGIPDKDDKCPTVPGIAKYNGCPIPDTDGDGINDEIDKCPTVPGVAKYNGCPIPDTDGDGVNDDEDRCPTIPGVKENQGCPIVKEEIVKKVQFAAKNIFFATGSSKLLPTSSKSLLAVAKILKDDANLKLDIEGHTDNKGTPAKNQVLSENRAKSVLEFLKTKGGIDESRMTAAGYGDTKPIADNKTVKGRSLNRRVELKLKY